jgi:hypothetical protein
MLLTRGGILAVEKEDGDECRPFISALTSLLHASGDVDAEVGLH